MTNIEKALRILDENKGGLVQLSREIHYKSVYIKYIQQRKLPMTDLLASRLIDWNSGKFIPDKSEHSKRELSLIKKLGKMYLKNIELEEANRRLKLKVSMLQDILKEKINDKN